MAALLVSGGASGGNIFEAMKRDVIAPISTPVKIEAASSLTAIGIPACTANG